MNRPIQGSEFVSAKRVSRDDLRRAYVRLAEVDVVRATVVVIRWGLAQVRPDAPTPPAIQEKTEGV